LIDAFEKTFTTLKKLMKDHGIKEAAYLNMMVTNGLFFVGTRYVTDPAEEPLTLYHSEGGRYVVEDGVSHMVAPEDDDQAVLIVSEKLTEDKNWTLIPKNHFVVVDAGLNVRIRPIKA
jgi:glutamine amidotransferase